MAIIVTIVVLKVRAPVRGKWWAAYQDAARAHEFWTGVS
jgi:hypothetical protein